MSTDMYNQIWRDAQKTVRVLLTKDEKCGRKERETDKQGSLNWVLRLYAEYIDIVRKLDESYDQIIQPQKRILIKKILEGCIGRLLELKNEILIELEKSNYSYFDDMLIERGLTPRDLEITSPRCFYREREIELAERRIFIHEITQAARKEADEEAEKLDKLEKQLETQLKRKEDAKNDHSNPASKLIEQEELVTDPADLKRRKLQADHIRALADAGAGSTEGGSDGVSISDKTAATPGVAAQKSKTLPSDEEISEAILIIQVHERARQSRRETFNKQAAIAKSKNDQGFRRTRRGKNIAAAPMDAKAIATTVERNHAAWIIKRAWRAYTAKKRETDKQLREDIVLGIVPKPYIDYSYRDRLLLVQRLRRIRQRELYKQYEEQILKEREFVDRVLGPQFFEDIGDEMREWIRIWFDMIFKLPKYPDEDEMKLKSKLLGLPKGTPDDLFAEIVPEIPGLKTRTLGGSNLITAGFWASAKQFLQAQEAIAKKKKGGTEKKAKLTKEEMKEAKLKRKQAQKSEKERLLAEKRRGFKLDPSSVIPALKVAEREYRKEWEFLRPDNENPTEEPYIALIRTEEAFDQQNQVRLAVDELMRAELELLLDAEWREKMKNKKKKKNRKKPKKKKGKKRGNKNKKDPTGDRTTEDLLAELVRAGIVRNYQYAHMDEYIGEYGYGHFEARQQFKEPMPTWMDTRQVLREFCILPLGNERVHELAPAGRSALIAGPPGVGKSLLVDILCTEVGALLIDLSVESVVGRYPGKQGMKTLMHLVNKVGRLLKPTVILLDNAHRTFYKKVPKDERFMEPKRMSKQMKKLVKDIKPGDQIMVVGTSNAPWLAKRGQFMKTFQRHIYVPPMDFGTRSFMWNKIIMEYKGVDRRFEVTPLANMTEWITLDTMKNVVKSVMTVSRITQLTRHPLQHKEIMSILMEMPPQPPTPKDRNKWDNFASKLPLVKAREKMVEEWAKAAAKNAKDKNKKKL